MMQLNSTAVSARFRDALTGAMTNGPRRRFTNLLLAVGVAAAATIPATLVTSVGAHAAGFDAVAAETQLIGEINADRAANGKGPLAVNATLSNIARGGAHSVCGSVLHGRSQDMIERNYFSHQVPPCGSYVWPILGAYGVQYSSAGENIGWNNYGPQSTSVDQVNSQFMNSPGHRANVLGDYNQVGVGAWMAPGGWTGNGASLNGVIMYTEIFTMGPPPPAAAPVPVVPTGPTPACASTTAGTGTIVPARGGHQLTISNRDGRIEAFGLGADGGLWHSWEATTNGNWTPWYSLGRMSSGAFASDPSVGINPDGRLEVFVTGSDGSVCHTWQTTPGGGWAQLASLGSPGTGFAGISSIATNTDGRMELFAVGRDGSAWHAWQWAAGGLSGWSSWYALGAPASGTFRGAVAPGRNGDGRLEITAIDTAGSMWHAWQVTPSGGWTRFYSLGGPAGGGVLGTPGNTTNGDGRLEIVARGADNALWHIWQTTPSGGWGNWYSLGGQVASDPNAGRNGDGRLEAFATTPGGSVVHIWQTSPGSGWIGPYALDTNGTSMVGTPQAATNVDGTMVALAQDALTQTFRMTKQWVPSGGWTPWSLLGGTTFPAY